MDSQQSITTILGASGTCPTIIHKGKTWKLGHPTGKAKSELETLVIRKATDETLALKNILEPQQYGEIFESFRLAVSAGQYRTGKPGWLATAFVGLNSPLFTLSLLRQNHPEATEQDVMTLAAEEPEQVMIALEVVAPPFFDLLLDSMELPPQEKAKVGEVFEQAKQVLIAKSQSLRTRSTQTNAA
jgi:hypothetical protein